jgi:hypothetical protein
MIAALSLATTMLTETATPARAFVDSIGVVTHFAYADTPYGNRFETVAQRLIDLGVRHVRDGVVLGDTLVCERERSLATHGVRFSYVTQPALSAGDIAAWAKCAGPALESFEGPNEYDLSHPAGDTDWAATLRAFQKTLYDAVKGNAALRSCPVIGPSLTSADAFRAVGDLSADLDFGNVHDYFAGHEPETPGYGLGGYGSIEYNLEGARLLSGAKPIVATETGYGTGTGHGDVPDDVQAAYVPRLFLTQFAAGIARTDEYELLDEGPEPFDRFGLLRSDLSPKPAYVALQSLIAALADGDATPRSERLSYSLEGDVPGLRHALFEKHDGRFVLALWIARPTIEPHTKLSYPVPLRTVHVRTDRPAALRALRFDASYRLVAGNTARGGIRVDLDDRVALVEIVPSPPLGLERDLAVNVADAMRDIGPRKSARIRETFGLTRDPNLTE